MGIGTPIYQVSPVFGAEAFAARSLSDEMPMLAVGNDVAALTNGLVRGLLTTDFVRGVAALMSNVTFLDEVQPRVAVLEGA
jgi:hypothetical protein